MNRIFHFDEYTLRPTNETDMAVAATWTEADPYHATSTPAGFWIEQTPMRESFILEDFAGPVFFFKVHRLSLNTVELHVQFPPAQPGDRERIHRGLIAGMRWLGGMLRTSGVHRVQFESNHVPLRKFAIRRLGFEASQGDTLLKNLGGD